MKKYRVYGIIPVINFIFLLLGIISFLWFYFDSTSNEKSKLLISLIVLLLILPLCLFVWSFVTMWACVILDETGVSKTLLGKKIRFIKWEEVKEIKVITPNWGYTNWLFISKVPLFNYSLSKCRLRRDNIFLVINQEILSIIKEKAPNEVIKNYFNGNIKH
jgi:hypothetical protein